MLDNKHRRRATLIYSVALAIMVKCRHLFTLPRCCHLIGVASCQFEGKVISRLSQFEFDVVTRTLISSIHELNVHENGLRINEVA